MKMLIKGLIKLLQFIATNEGCGCVFEGFGAMEYRSFCPTVISPKVVSPHFLGCFTPS